jgi:hypothetical protein
VIASDPSGITLPRVRRAEAAMTLPSAAQVGALLEAPGKWQALVAVGAFAGLRVTAGP